MVTIEELKTNTEERLWSKIKFGEINECWEWQRSTNIDGYGIYGVRRIGKHHLTVIVHRHIFILLFGKLPKDVCALHKCDNRKCCNPNHLYAGTRIVNNRDRHDKGRDGSAKGENNAKAKLKETDIVEIRKRIANGEYQYVIAKDYHVDQTIISDINLRYTWKHLK